MRKILRTTCAFFVCLSFFPVLWWCLPSGGPEEVQALEIRVRAKSEIDARVEAAGTILQVAGTLKDDAGRGLPQRELHVRITQRDSPRELVDREILTGARGEFSIQEELPPGHYDVAIEFRRTEHVDAGSFRDDVQLEPEPLRVRVYGPPYVHGRSEPAVVYSRAYAGRTGVKTPAVLLVNGVKVDEFSLDTTGRATVDVASYLREGENVVEVVVPGSAYRDEARAGTRIRFSENATLTAAIDSRLQRLSRGLSIHGRLSDGAGPVVGARIQTTFEAISVAEGREPPGEVTVVAQTDEDGYYSGFVDSSRFPDGVWTGQARLIPAAGEKLVAETGRLEQDTKAFRWTLSGLGILALLAGFVMLFWRGIGSLMQALNRLRENRRKKAKQREVLEEEEEIVPVYLGEDDEVGGRRAATEQNDLGGLVWDEWREERVAGARIELRDDGDEVILHAESHENGRFRLEDVPKGEYSLVASAPGFMRGVMKVEVPHRGRLANFRLDLVAVPLKIRRLYQMVVESTAGEDSWGAKTPREIEAELARAMREDLHAWEDPDSRREFHDRVVQSIRQADESFGPEELCAVMTDIVEESYYSGRQYDEGAFRVARSVALRLRDRAEERKEVS